MIIHFYQHINIIRKPFSEEAIEKVLTHTIPALFTTTLIESLLFLCLHYLYPIITLENLLQLYYL